jgi:Tfp pilus assembly protein PilP
MTPRERKRMARVRNLPRNRTLFTVWVALLSFLFILQGNVFGEAKKDGVVKSTMVGLAKGVTGVSGSGAQVSDQPVNAKTGSEPKGNPNANKALEPKKFNVEDFTFTAEKRRDPFQPVFLTRLKHERAMKTGSKGGYELEELKFVGTLKTDKQRSAMMEDRQGKGMLFRKGDHLNNNLWVVDILEDKMVLGHKLKNEVRKIILDIPKK